MQVLYNAKYTHYSTPSGNTQFILYRRKTKTEADAITLQIVLGIALVILGIVAIAIMPEDGTAGLICFIMGACVIGGNLKKKKENDCDIMIEEKRLRRF